MASFYSSLIPSVFKALDAGTSKSKPYEKYIFDQQAGVAARIYPNDGSEPINLFWQIESCMVDRSTTNLGGSFTLTLLGTDPWDDMIRGDDYIRIFMGDQVVASRSPNPAAYNVASGDFRQSAGFSEPSQGIIFVPVPGTSGKSDRNVKYLAMYERCCGKIDRVEAIATTPSADGASVTMFQVTGRLLSSVVEDISLYYNEFLPGLNAPTVFFNSGILNFGSPDEYVKTMLSVVLSEIPMPQWILPDTFSREYLGAAALAGNKALVDQNLASFRQTLASLQQTQKSQQTPTTIQRLNRLIQDAQNNRGTTPFSIMSVQGIRPCYGRTFIRDTPTLDSKTTGLVDMLKNLSNPNFNEFWFDMAPGGDPVNGGPATSARPLPSFCLRQRPYNVTESMIRGVQGRTQRDAAKLSDFSPVTLANISSSLEDLDSSAIVLTGAMANTGLEGSVAPDRASYLKIPGGISYIPTVLAPQYGYSNHDRVNFWAVLGSYNAGQAHQSDRAYLYYADGYRLDPDSILKYGFRVMEVSTQYAQPEGNSTVSQTQIQYLKNFTATLANWYFLNSNFMNGKIACRFLPEARLGVPVKYYVTRPTAAIPYPREDRFYCQGVTDEYRMGEGIRTTLTVIRGIRRRLDDVVEVTAANDLLKNLRGRVDSIFQNISRIA